MNTKVFKPLPVIDSNYDRTNLVYHPICWPKYDPNIKPIKKYVTVRNRIRVSKLDRTIKQGDLHEEFSCFGPIALITKIKHVRINDTDRKKEGYSYITFFLEDDAKLALKSATKCLKGCSILVEQATQDVKKVNFRLVPLERIYSMQTILAILEKYKKLFLEQDVGCNKKVCYAFIHRIDSNMPKNMKRSTILDPDSYDESSSTSLDDVESRHISESNFLLEENSVSIIENGWEFNPENLCGLNNVEFNNFVYPNPIYIESHQTYFQDPVYLNYQESEYLGLNNVEFNNFVYPKPIYIESDQTYLEDPDYLNYQISKYGGLSDAEFNNFVYPKPIYIESDQTHLDDPDYLNYQELEYPLTTPNAYYYGENQIIYDLILQDSLVPVHRNDNYYDLNNEYCIPEENLNYDPYYVDSSMYQDALVPIINLNAFETGYNQFYEFSPTVIATFHEYGMSNQLNVENQYADLSDSDYIQVHSSQLNEYETNDQYYDEAHRIDLTEYEEIEMPNMQLNYGTFEVPHLIEQPMIPQACEMREHETNYQYYNETQIYDFTEHNLIDMPMMPLIQENDGTSAVPYLIEQPMILPACQMLEHETNYQYYDDTQIYDSAEHDLIDMPMMPLVQKNDGTSEAPYLIEQPMILPACQMLEHETNYQYYDNTQIYDSAEHDFIDMPMMPLVQENDGTSEVHYLIEQPMIPPACEMREHETNYQYYDDTQIHDFAEHDLIDMPMVQENDGTSEVPYLIEQPMIPLACAMHEYGADYRYYDDAHISDFANYDGMEMSAIVKNDVTSEVPHINPYQHYSATCNELVKQLDVWKDKFLKLREVDKRDELKSQCNVNDTVEDANNSIIFSEDCSTFNRSNLLQITETVIEPSTSINKEIKQDAGKSEIELKIPDKAQDKCEIIDNSSKCGFYVSVRDVATQFPEYSENLINTFTTKVHEASLQNMETQTINTPENANKESTPLRLTFANVTKRAKRQN